MVRLRLGTLHALAGDWLRLRPHLANDEHLAILQELHSELQPRLQIPVAATHSPTRLRRALVDLQASLARFNRLWQKAVQTIDLGAINDIRDGYNRNFLVEKECAVGSARLARLGFQRLAPITHADLIQLFPPLPALQD
jgi:hypothetical protein